MELKEFLERFLPNYKPEWSYTVEKFPEALQNYTDKVCEMQRENCAKNSYESTSNRQIGILNAEQQKIEEI